MSGQRHTYTYRTGTATPLGRRSLSARSGRGPHRGGGLDVDDLNFADRPGDASRAFDEETYRRLREIKATVDSDGLFVAAHPVV